ncbi:MAG: glutaredoxin family protein [Calditrichaeota bacterium]|nr:glutaredoxin family protein [Calditrichota bacterium]
MYEYEVTNRIPLLFALSTCPRCNRMKKFLQDNGVNAKIIDVDLLPLEEKKKHFRFLLASNPTLAFPTLLVGNVAVIGEDYDGAKEALNL